MLEKVKKNNSIIFYFKLLLIDHKKILFKLCIALLLGSMFQYISPYFTQLIVDKGISNKDLNYIELILLGQILFFLGQSSLNVYRNWLLLHLGTNLSLKLTYDFLSKFLNVPFSFLETKSSGDILQRITDIRRIDFFLSNTVLSTVFSVINIIVYSVIILTYNYFLFLIHFVASVLLIVWVNTFSEKRKNIDNQQFMLNTVNHNKILQLINGIKDIKINNAESLKLTDWMINYNKLNKTKLKSLLLIQFLQSGFISISQLRNILITFFSASLVINNEISIGAMMAIMFINGQLSTPIEQLIGFNQYYNEAKLSLDRLSEFKELKEESKMSNCKIYNLSNRIIVKNLSFCYPLQQDKLILSNINFNIDSKKFVALVGKSGSGKTTLIKLFLKYYDTYKGEIYFGKGNLKQYNNHDWRKICSMVMTDGYVFSESISKNIAIGDSHIDLDKVAKVCKIANIHDYIMSLSNGYETILDQNAKGISDGQKQRILIARALYKNPQFLFMDEATNALDPENELIILNNLRNVESLKTIFFVTHRPSALKWANYIIVMENGRIVEEGNHTELNKKRRFYYNLFST